jgi:hypothetical protein
MSRWASSLSSPVKFLSMEEKEDLMNHSNASNVQVHEIVPAAEGMSFGALLEKFYMETEDDKKAASGTTKDIEIGAQNLVDISKNDKKKAS